MLMPKKLSNHVANRGKDELTGYANHLNQLSFGKSSAPVASFAITESLKAMPTLAEDDTEDEFDKTEDKLGSSKYVVGL